MGQASKRISRSSVIWKKKNFEVFIQCRQTGGRADADAADGLPFAIRMQRYDARILSWPSRPPDKCSTNILCVCLGERGHPHECLESGNRTICHEGVNDFPARDWM